MHKTFTAIGIVLGSIAVLLVVGSFILPPPPPIVQQTASNASNSTLGGIFSGLQSLFTQQVNNANYNAAGASQTGGMSPVNLAGLGAAVAGI